MRPFLSFSFGYVAHVQHTFVYHPSQLGLLLRLVCFSVWLASQLGFFSAWLASQLGLLLSLACFSDWFVSQLGLLNSQLGSSARLLFKLWIHLCMLDMGHVPLFG